MKRSIVVFGCLLALMWAVSSCIHRNAALSSGHISPCDPALVTGTLPNGFRYLIMENKTPKDRVQIHLDVFAGSALEQNQEQGLAHYLEHMMFNGSRHFKPGELIKYFQSMGMDFGHDANAHTSYFNTVYDLVLPGGDQKSLEDIFVVIKDYAQGALLLESEIDREKGVILAEKRERDSVSFRTLKKTLAFELPGSILPDRMPIGVEATIKGANREKLKGFYDRWYRPDNMALVVVGDLDTGRAKALITKAFSSMKARSDLPATCPDIAWTPHKGVKSFFYAEPEAGTTEVTIEHISFEPFDAETVDRMLADTVRYVADQMFQNRLSGMVQARTGGFTGARVYSGQYLKNAKTTAVQAECDPTDWENCLEHLSQSLTQALKFGFFQAELERVKAEILCALDAAVQAAATRNSSAISAQLLAALNHRELFLSPGQEQSILAPFIKTLSIETVNRTFRNNWPDDHRLVMVTGNLPAMKNAEAGILNVYNRSQNLAVGPYAQKSQKNFPYLVLPDARAQVVNMQDNVNGLGICRMKLANNIHVNLKQTDFKKGRLFFTAVFGSGRLGIPKTFFGLDSLAVSTVNSSGLGRMDREQLNAALSGRDITLSFDIKENHCCLSGQAALKDAEQVFQLLYAYFNDPGFRAESLALEKVRYCQDYERKKQTPDGAMQIQAARFLAGGDLRFGLADPAKLENITINDLSSWLGPEFDTSPLEISISGDMNCDEIKKLVKTYLGAMKSRRPAIPQKPVGPGPVFPKGETLKIYPDTRLTDMGVICLAFPTDDFWDIMKTRKLAVLSQVLSERLRNSVREDLGASYSPYVYNAPSMIYDGYGVMNFVVKMAPGMQDTINDIIINEIKDVLENGVSHNELDFVKKPLLNHLNDLRRENTYWLDSVMANSFRYPERLEWADTLISGFSDIKAGELTDLARHYLCLSNRALILVLPLVHN